MLLPYNVDVPMIRLPLANWVLIGVTVLISMNSIVTRLTETAVHPAEFLNEQNPRAARDLHAIHEYLVKRSPQGAANVMTAIFADVELVRRHPEAARR